MLFDGKVSIAGEKKSGTEKKGIYHQKQITLEFCKEVVTYILRAQ